MVRLRRKGIFYLIEGDEAKDLASKLGLKLLEKKTTGPSGDVDLKISCGFPKSGLDKYIGKLVRLGEDVTVVEDGRVVEEIEIKEEGRR